MRPFITQPVALMLNKSLILPLLDYCDCLLVGTSNQNAFKLQKIQNRACRIILRADIYHNIRNMHGELNILTLGERREFHLATQVYKCTSDLAPSYLGDSLTQIDAVHHYNTRARINDNFYFTHARRAIGDRAFSRQGPRLYNTLPPEIRQAESVTSFKQSYLNYKGIRI